MAMLTHLTIGTNDVMKARAFYDAALGALGHAASDPAAPYLVYRGDGPTFIVLPPTNGQPATSANGGTISFAAKSAADVDAFHAAGLASGGACEGKPGVRANAPRQAYGAYLRDPDGSKICAFAPNPDAAT